jgi:GntR family transcriptional regulator/MocR family aminotransferase
MKKNVIIYKQRRNFLCQCLEKYFKGDITFQVPTGGLAIWVQFDAKISLVKLAEQAEKNDLFLPKTILYQDRDTCAIRFGFGHLNENDTDLVVKKLKESYDAILNS